MAELSFVGADAWEQLPYPDIMQARGFLSDACFCLSTACKNSMEWMEGVSGKSGWNESEGRRLALKSELCRKFC